MVHDLIQIWFGWVRDGGYFGVFLLMALESTIIPVPSEIVMPPAAFWAAQGHLNFWGVVAAGTTGSYVGSTFSYWVFYLVGDRITQFLFRLKIVKEKKMNAAAHIVETHGAVGIFMARLLPVARHLVSMPAGLFKLSFRRFSFVTLLGAGLWCYILAEWGQRVIGRHPEIMNSPEEMMAMIRQELMSFVIFVIVIASLYAFVQWQVYRFGKKK